MIGGELWVLMISSDCLNGRLQCGGKSNNPAWKKVPLQSEELLSKLEKENPIWVR
jgi:hypothetical protein